MLQGIAPPIWVSTISPFFAGARSLCFLCILSLTLLFFSFRCFLSLPFLSFFLSFVLRLCVSLLGRGLLVLLPTIGCCRCLEEHLFRFSQERCDLPWKFPHIDSQFFLYVRIVFQLVGTSACGSCM